MSLLEELSPREGKCLRYVVSTRTQPVQSERLVNSIEWSDLPKTVLQARSALEKLRDRGLVERAGAGYSATPAGVELIGEADRLHVWQQPGGMIPRSTYKPRRQQQ
jgi:hypothetical protein